VERALTRAAVRSGFRVFHYSIQSNHVHFLAEANDRAALTRGMKGLLVGMARALNRLWARAGSVFADRYHARRLSSPVEVRSALVHVLQNAEHHGIRGRAPDEYSSGQRFDGWKQNIGTAKRASPVAPATTWLLRVGRRRLGLIGIDEAPRRARR
jgi:REP element-mobilizing transposase RayT